MNPKQILEQTITQIRKDLTEAESKLEALDKVELRHGDYGWSKSDPKKLRFFVETAHGKILHYENKPYGMDPCVCGRANTYTILGNIFDDLKGGDLEEFEVKCAGSGVLKVGKGIANPVQFRMYDETATATLDQAKQIHRKLGRLIATQAKKAKK